MFCSRFSASGILLNDMLYSYGNQRTVGGEELSANVQSLLTRDFREVIEVNCSVTDHGFGNYTLSYVVTKSSQSVHPPPAVCALSQSSGQHGMQHGMHGKPSYYMP